MTLQELTATVLLLRACPDAAVRARALELVPGLAEHDQPVPLLEAARSLGEHLFGALPRIPHPGNVGVGTNELYVYVSVLASQWRGPKPHAWRGYPVTWAFRSAPAVVG